jgi:hypothetical protein
MAVTCARCGAVNPDGNRFCQSCGTPLTATVPAPPPAQAAVPAQAAYASPPPAPAAYQSPYYVPTGAAQAPVHRTPWVLIISAIVVLLVVMAGCGTAIALLGNRAANTNGGGLAAGVPSPSPEGSPSPIPSPIATGGATASNDGETIPVPAGWAVDSKDSETITLTNPDGDGSVTVGSGASSPIQSAQQNKATIDKYFEGKYPDTKTCPNSKTTNGTLNGAAGIFWELCFTIVSGGQSVQAAAPLFAGANSSGSVYYVVMLITSADNMQGLVTDATPILEGIQWKLK